MWRFFYVAMTKKRNIHFINVKQIEKSLSRKNCFNETRGEAAITNTNQKTRISSLKLVRSEKLDESQK